jgi:hypothetical protein
MVPRLVSSVAILCCCYARMDGAQLLPVPHGPELDFPCTTDDNGKPATHQSVATPLRKLTALIGELKAEGYISTSGAEIAVRIVNACYSKVAVDLHFLEQDRSSWKVYERGLDDLRAAKREFRDILDRNLGEVDAKMLGERPSDAIRALRRGLHRGRLRYVELLQRERNKAKH